MPAVLPLQVLILAEDPLVRAGLGSLLALADGIAICGQIAPGTNLQDALELYRPHAILWDAHTRAPGASHDLAGLPNNHPPIIALVTDQAAAAAAWSAGVKGVIDRSAAGPALAAALQAAAQGLSVFEAPFLPAAVASNPPTGDAPLQPLTPREMEVLRALAEGLPNKEIAQKLGITEHTVKFHVNALLGKLGATSRTEAVVRASRAGLIPL